MLRRLLFCLLTPLALHAQLPLLQTTHPWPDTLTIWQAKTDTLDSLPVHASVIQTLPEFGGTICQLGFTFHFLKPAGNRWIDIPLSEEAGYERGVFFEKYWLQDITGDGIPELHLQVRQEFAEFYFEDVTSRQIVTLYTWDLQHGRLLLVAETGFRYSWQDTTYDNEKKIIESGEMPGKVIKVEEGEGEFLYTVREEENYIRIICTRYQLYDRYMEKSMFPNAGIAVYRLQNDRWVRREE
jgi:hypothetical protein